MATPNPNPVAAITENANAAKNDKQLEEEAIAARRAEILKETEDHITLADDIAELTADQNALLMQGNTDSIAAVESGREAAQATAAAQRAQTRQTENFVSELNTLQGGKEAIKLAYKRWGDTRDEVVASQEALNDIDDTEHHSIGIINNLIKDWKSQPIEEKLELDTQRLAQYSQNIQTSSANVKHATSIAGDMKRTVNDASTIAEIATIDAHWKTIKARTQINNAGMRMSSLADTLAASRTRLKIKIDQNMIHNSFMEDDNKALRTEMLQGQVDALNARKEDRAADAASLDQRVEFTIVGLSMVSPNKYPKQYIRDQMELPESQRLPELVHAMHAGMTNTLGANPVEAAKVMDVVGAPANQHIKAFFQKNAGDTPEITGQQVADSAIRELSKIESGDQTNFFIAPSNDAMEQAAEIAKNKVWNDIIKVHNVELSDHNAVMELIMDATDPKSRTITDDEAIEAIALFYGTAGIINSDVKNYASVGIPNQTSYHASFLIKAHSFSGRDERSITTTKPESFDLTNPLQIKRLIQLMRINNERIDLLGGI